MYKVLQVEDLPSDAYLIRREVKKVLDPCEFRNVETREAFLKELIEFQPDIIISDFSIPGFDWLSAFKLAEKHAPHTPFIVVSGSWSEEIGISCMKAGVTEFVNKGLIRNLGPAILKALKIV